MSPAIPRRIVGYTMKCSRATTATSYVSNLASVLTTSSSSIQTSLPTVRTFTQPKAIACSRLGASRITLAIQATSHQYRRHLRPHTLAFPRLLGYLRCSILLSCRLQTGRGMTVILTRTAIKCNIPISSIWAIYLHATSSAPTTKSH